MMNQSNKTILFVSRAFGENAGGMERLSFELISAFQKDSSVITKTVIHRGSRLLAPLFAFTSIPSVLSAAKQADVIHLGDPMLSLAGFLVKKLLKKKVAVTVHGLDITYPNFLYQIYLNMFFSGFDTYLPISKAVGEVLQKKYSLKGNVAVINPGMHDSFYDPSITREHLSTLLKEDTTNKVILYTNGRLAKRKGHAWFIERILPKLPEHTVYVVSGSGPQEEHIFAASKKVGVESRIKLLGRISDKDSKILYNTVDAFIQPNISVPGDMEGFGLVLLEAASCARPVFAANIEGMKDAIVNGKNGTLLESQNANQWVSTLQQWIASGEYKNRANAILARTFTIQNFSWEKAIQKYREALLS